MSKRFTDTEIWDLEWFMGLDQKHKLLIKFIFDKCDVAGIWKPNWPLTSVYIGEKCTIADLEPLKSQVKELSSGRFFVPDFVSFQYGELSEACNPHKKVISILKKERLLEGYLKGTFTLQDKEEDKDKEKDKDKAKDIPTEIEFLEYCKTLLNSTYSSYEFSLRAKRSQWVENGWKDGYGKKIKNWKTTIQNVIPHLKPTKNGNHTATDIKANPQNGYGAL